jgi:hypothetical protein
MKIPNEQYTFNYLDYEVIIIKDKASWSYFTDPILTLEDKETHDNERKAVNAAIDAIDDYILEKHGSFTDYCLSQKEIIVKKPFIFEKTLERLKTYFRPGRGEFIFFVIALLLLATSLSGKVNQIIDRVACNVQQHL